MWKPSQQSFKPAPWRLCGGGAPQTDAYPNTEALPVQSSEHPRPVALTGFWNHLFSAWLPVENDTFHCPASHWQVQHVVCWYQRPSPHLLLVLDLEKTAAGSCGVVYILFFFLFLPDYVSNLTGSLIICAICGAHLPLTLSLSQTAQKFWGGGVGVTTMVTLLLNKHIHSLITFY